MIYRIVMAPPGYPRSCRFMVVAYRNRDFGSRTHELLNADGTRFFKSLKLARQVLPATAVRQASEADHQFVEIWEDKGGRR